MEILLKYCGGCNPDINRSKIVNDVKRGLSPDIKPVAQASAKPAEVGIMMAGCTTCCLDRNEIRELVREWIIVSGNYVNYFPVDNEHIAAIILQKIVDYLSNKKIAAAD